MPLGLAASTGAVPHRTDAPSESVKTAYRARETGARHTKSSALRHAGRTKFDQPVHAGGWMDGWMETLSPGWWPTRSGPLAVSFFFGHVSGLHCPRPGSGSRPTVGCKAFDTATRYRVCERFIYTLHVHTHAHTHGHACTTAAFTKRYRATRW